MKFLIPFSLISILLLSMTPAVKADKPSSLQAQAKTVLFLRKDGTDFQQVSQSISKDLSKYSIKDVIIHEGTPFSEFAATLQKEKPQLTVLMDNQAIEYALKWNRENANPIPGVALMGLNIRELLNGSKKIAGISYEPPAYSLVTQFRMITEVPVKRVAVLYRSSLFGKTIQLAKSQLAIEHIQLDAIDVERNGKEPAAIETFLKTVEPKGYDALWCMLDSKLLTPHLFESFWLPFAQKLKAPILTSVEQLVQPDFNFAAFAVTPDLTDLASQAVQMVDRILEGGESPDRIGVEQLISVQKVLNLKRMKDLGIQIPEDSLLDVKILK